MSASGVGARVLEQGALLDTELVEHVSTHDEANCMLPGTAWVSIEIMDHSDPSIPFILLHAPDEFCILGVLLGLMSSMVTAPSTLSTA